MTEKPAASFSALYSLAICSNGDLSEILRILFLYLFKPGPLLPFPLSQHKGAVREGICFSAVTLN